MSETQPVREDLIAIQGVEQRWELCPLPGGFFSQGLYFISGGLDTYVLSTLSQPERVS